MIKRIIFSFLFFAITHSIFSQEKIKLVAEGAYAEYIPQYISTDWSKFFKESPYTQKLKKSMRIMTNVSQKTEKGSFSDYFFREVVFVSGEYLNENQFNSKIDNSKTYAMIWFSQEEVAIVELDQSVFLRLTITQESFDYSVQLNKNLFTGNQINGRITSNWKFCFFSESMSDSCP